jgi:Tfp pilus assembly protein PilP
MATQPTNLPQYDASGGFTSGGQYYAANSQQAINSHAYPQSTPINANIIGNTTPLNIPKYNSNTAQTALGITAATAAQPENTQIIEPPEPTQSQGGMLKDKIASLIGLQGTQGEKTLEWQKEQGLDQKQIALNDINKKITTTKRSYEEQIKELRKNKEGKFGGAVEADVANLTRTANEDLANLAIIQAGTQGDYQTALNIVEQKVKAEFEPIQNEIKNYEALYNLVQDDLTESEKVQVQAQLDEKRMKAEQDFTLRRDAELQKYDLQKIAYGHSFESSGGSGGVVTINGKPQNVAQSTANGYADRLGEANVILENLGDKFSKTLRLPSPNAFKSGDRQSYEQAQSNFVTAVLRRESGAAISDSEFTTARDLYFPKYGDTANTIAQKAMARNTVINNFYRDANVARPVLPGQIIKSGGKKYKVGLDGQTLTEIK